MSPLTIFNVHLILGYVAWLLCFRAYILPSLKSWDLVVAERAIATLHSFRFFGLVFIMPGVVGNLPAGFAPFAAYWDFATGVLALLALMSVRIRPLFWFFVVAFNLDDHAPHRILFAAPPPAQGDASLRQRSSGVLNRMSGEWSVGYAEVIRERHSLVAESEGCSGIAQETRNTASCALDRSPQACRSLS
jgi:hypothetical protein